MQKINGLLQDRQTSVSVSAIGGTSKLPYVYMALVNGRMDDQTGAAADLSTALDVLAGSDERESIAYRYTLPPSRHCALKDFRVLVILHAWANRSRRSLQHGPGHRPPHVPDHRI
jgi:hypothetical protein